MTSFSGHIKHLHEAKDLTLGEIKEILVGIPTRKIPQFEKVDGFNLYMSVREGKPIAARNKQDMKEGGVTEERLKTFSTELQKGIRKALKILDSFISGLDQADLEAVFGSATAVFYNCEVIGEDFSNITKYNRTSLIVHSSSHYQYDIASRKISPLTNEQHFVAFSRFLDDFSAGEKGLSAGQPLEFVSPINPNIYTKRLDVLFSRFKMNDGNTIGDWRKAKILRDIQISSFAWKMSEQERKTAAEILNRDVNFKQVSSSLSPNGRQQISEILPSKEKGKVFLAECLEPLEKIFHDYSTQLLGNAKSTYIDSNEEEVERIKSNLKLVSQKLLQYSGPDEEKIRNTVSNKLKKISGFHNINTPVEGIVFPFKGNVYKMTGNFAHINQILGIHKYGRGEMAPAKPETLNEMSMDFYPAGHSAYNVTTTKDTSTIAVFPGSFKPPHAGHWSVVKYLLDHQQADGSYTFYEVHVLVSSLKRTSSEGSIEISAEVAEEIWKVYGRESERLKICVCEGSPVKAAYEFLKEVRAESNVYLVKSEKDTSDDRFESIEKFISKNNLDITVNHINAPVEVKVNARDMRDALANNNLEFIQNFLPDHLTKEEVATVMSKFKKKRNSNSEYSLDEVLKLGSGLNLDDEDHAQTIRKALEYEKSVTRGVWAPEDAIYVVMANLESDPKYYDKVKTQRVNENVSSLDEGEYVKFVFDNKEYLELEELFNHYGTTLEGSPYVEEESAETAELDDEELYQYVAESSRRKILEDLSKEEDEEDDEFSVGRTFKKGEFGTVRKKTGTEETPAKELARKFDAIKTNVGAGGSGLKTNTASNYTDETGKVVGLHSMKPKDYEDKKWVVKINKSVIDSIDKIIRLARKRSRLDSTYRDLATQSRDWYYIVNNLTRIVASKMNESEGTEGSWKTGARTSESKRDEGLLACYVAAFSPMTGFQTNMREAMLCYAALKADLKRAESDPTIMKALSTFLRLKNPLSAVRLITKDLHFTVKKGEVRNITDSEYADIQRLAVFDFFAQTLTLLGTKWGTFSKVTRMYIKAGNRFTLKDAESLLKLDLDLTKNTERKTGKQKDRVLSSMSLGPNQRRLLGKTKVANFGLNIISPDLKYDTDDFKTFNVTIDSWMVRFFYPGIFSAEAAAPPEDLEDMAGEKTKEKGVEAMIFDDPKSYYYISSIVKEKAEKFKLKPHQLQAILWVHMIKESQPNAQASAEDMFNFYNNSVKLLAGATKYFQQISDIIADPEAKTGFNLPDGFEGYSKTKDGRRAISAGEIKIINGATHLMSEFDLNSFDADQVAEKFKGTPGDFPLMRRVIEGRDGTLQRVTAKSGKVTLRGFKTKDGILRSVQSVRNKMTNEEELYVFNPPRDEGIYNITGAAPRSKEYWDMARLSRYNKKDKEELFFGEIRKMGVDIPPGASRSAIFSYYESKKKAADRLWRKADAKKVGAGLVKESKDFRSLILEMAKEFLNEDTATVDMSKINNKKTAIGSPQKNNKKTSVATMPAVAAKNPYSQTGSTNKSFYERGYRFKQDELLKFLESHGFKKEDFLMYDPVKKKQIGRDNTAYDAMKKKNVGDDIPVAVFSSGNFGETGIFQIAIIPAYDLSAKQDKYVETQLGASKEIAMVNKITFGQTYGENQVPDFWKTRVENGGFAYHFNVLDTEPNRMKSILRFFSLTYEEVNDDLERNKEKRMPDGSFLFEKDDEFLDESTEWWLSDKPLRLKEKQDIAKAGSFMMDWLEDGGTIPDDVEAIFDAGTRTASPRKVRLVLKWFYSTAPGNY